ncbi:MULTISPECIES: TrkA family potassium uptake protein [unclassified Mycoplasma]|uniref:NAD-binding protein n=1 Tax=unclassified Mycoplasma TaxID=2683645 RepID=UPI000FDEC12C
MSKNVNDICVIGIGRFGLTVVKQLIELRKYVLAIDRNKENLKEVSRNTNTVVVDGTDIEGLRAVGINLFETVIVATSDNIEIVASLIELGAKNIIAKAKSATHERVLKHIGVDIIIRPEYEAGIRAALIATSTNFIKYSKSLQEIGDGYAIGSTALRNRDWINRPLKNLKFNKLGVSVVSIKRGPKVHLPSGNVTLGADDLITVVGKISNIVNAFGELNAEHDPSPSAALPSSRIPDVKIKV